mgnify:CR=1 FL=1
MRFINSRKNIVIECEECTKYESPHCEDCVVTFLCNEETTTAVVIDLEEYRLMQIVSDVGLVPPLRHSQPISII